MARPLSGENLFDEAVITRNSRGFIGLGGAACAPGRLRRGVRPQSPFGGYLMTLEKYNRGAQVFHWVIAALVIANLAFGLLHEPLEKTINLMPMHKAIGLTILLLTLGRIGWRLTWTKPPLPDSIGPLDRAVASATHTALYALMLILPVTGWIFSSPSKYPLTWFGLFDWPRLPVAKDAPLAGISHEAHEVLGFVMLALVVLHIAAALRHQFVLKNGLIRRMI